jgi:hypothetical protein|nr:MAG TPA_asm: hypothetical protein [Caudoviricetes sp.]
MVKAFEFKIYKKNEAGYKKALVIAESQGEAEDKFVDADIEFYDYECTDYKEYVSAIA